MTFSLRLIMDKLWRASLVVADVMGFTPKGLGASTPMGFDSHALRVL